MTPSQRKSCRAHRRTLDAIVDGREAVTFLVRIKEMLEDPARLLIDV